MVDKPGTYKLDDICRAKTVEDRISPSPCVQLAMVVPGRVSSSCLEHVGVQRRQNNVAFENAVRQRNDRPRNAPMCGPTREGLRLTGDDPLTWMHGPLRRTMPNQNGAPIGCRAVGNTASSRSRVS